MKHNFSYEWNLGQKRKVDRKKGRPKPKPRQRGRQPEPEPEFQPVKCYFCSVNFFATKFDVTNLCYNPGHNFTVADAEYLTTCSSTTKFCTVDITRLGGGLIGVDRKCGSSTCNYFCLNKGYGAEIQTCTHCCPGKPTIDLDLLEEGEVVPPYQCPSSRIWNYQNLSKPPCLSYLWIYSQLILISLNYINIYSNY